MRKLNLLLATTAILAVSAFNVNAEQSTYTTDGIEVPVNVTLLEKLKYEVTQNLDFGVAMVATNDTIAIPASTGTVTPTGAIMLKNGARGYIEINGSYGIEDTNLSLVLPTDNIALSTVGEEYDCGYVNNFSQSQNIQNDYLKGFYVGGTFTAEPEHGTLSFGQKSDCQGSFTVTLVHIDPVTPSVP